MGIPNSIDHNPPISKTNMATMHILKWKWQKHY